MDVRNYCSLVSKTMLELEKQQKSVNNIVSIINSCKNGTIYTIGNGGSSSVAAHFSQGLFNKGYKTKCLSDSVPIITGIANDYDYQYVFKKQLRFTTTDDIVIAFSVSGTSKNICAIEGINATIIGVLGNNGGDAINLCSTAITFNSKHFQSVEDVFSIVAHLIELEISQNNG